MTQGDFDKAVLVMAAWQLAKSNDVNELLAICCVVRNWVVPRFNAKTEPMTDKVYHASYTDAVKEFLRVYPTRELPAINEPMLVDPVEGLLLKVDVVYDCSLVDLTSSRAFPQGARYFGRVTQATDWFKQMVLDRQNVHPLIGNFGAQSFYA